MSWRTAHGNAARLGALVVVEGAPADELPEGVPGPTRPVGDWQDAGRFASGPGTSALAAAGGRAKAEARQMARLLGLREPSATHAPYARLAREWLDAHATDLGQTMGGGKLSPGVLACLSSAALALGASRYLYDEGAEKADPKLLAQAARLADQSRTSLLTATELAAREAKAREDDDGAELRRQQAEFQRRLLEQSERPDLGETEEHDVDPTP